MGYAESKRHCQSKKQITATSVMKQIFKATPGPAFGADRVNQFFLAGATLESVLVKDYNIDLTHNAAFELLYTHEGRMLMKQYHELYLQLAERYQLTYILETPTWRANRDWIYRLGYDYKDAAAVNQLAVQFIRETQLGKNCDVIISGSVGPRHDDFDSTYAMTSDESELYHSEQIRAFALQDVDIITARAFNDSNEAIGVVKACSALGIPVVISFKINHDGNLASGESLGKAISRVDQETRLYPTYYTLYCDNLETVERLIRRERLIHRSGYWNARLHGIQITAKTSASDLTTVKEHFPNLKIVGGCGFDFSTLDELCRKFIAE
jgi:S-methylmethionine-dependent homocysteine/selenocysteine methylase